MTDIKQSDALACQVYLESLGMADGDAEYIVYHALEGPYADAHKPCLWEWFAHDEWLENFQIIEQGQDRETVNRTFNALVQHAIDNAS